MLAREEIYSWLIVYFMEAVVFVAHDFTGTPTETEEAVPLWTAIDAIPFDEMWPDDRYWLPLALREENGLFGVDFFYKRRFK